MGKKLYIGGLPYSTSQEALASLFSIITDRETGRSKGFAFVEMSSDGEAQAAIDKFNGQNFEGRRLTVNEARPQPPRENRGPRPSRY
jgi:RNA recognition motif-containing protein